MDAVGRLAVNHQGRLGRITSGYRLWGGREYTEGVGILDGEPWKGYDACVLSPATEQHILDGILCRYSIQELHAADWWCPLHIGPKFSDELWTRARQCAGIPQPRGI